MSNRIGIVVTIVLVAILASIPAEISYFPTTHAQTCPQHIYKFINEPCNQLDNCTTGITTTYNVAGHPPYKDLAELGYGVKCYPATVTVYNDAYWTVDD